MNYALTESGIIVPEYIMRKPKRITAFEFFCGAGGFSLGFLAGGYEIVGANEWDADAALTYLANLGSYPMQIHYVEGEKDKDRLNKSVRREWGINIPRRRALNLTRKIEHIAVLKQGVKLLQACPNSFDSRRAAAGGAFRDAYPSRIINRFFYAAGFCGRGLRPVRQTIQELPPVFVKQYRAG
ncbi:MAG: hypothetical protein Pg6A_12540 [Termitinemataceae bacterium]|nr:MAG: hypothetical protein Pg6A_12540 [Termitinemataceae bacterium]